MMDISRKIEELVSYHSGAKIEKLTMATLIEEDLGTTGDDVWELLDDIHEKFGVEFKNFDFSLHFSPEAGSNKNKDYGYYPVSIGHLVSVTENKEWFMPPKNEQNYSRVKERIKRTNAAYIIGFTCIIVILLIWQQG